MASKIFKRSVAKLMSNGLPAFFGAAVPARAVRVHQTVEHPRPRLHGAATGGAQWYVQKHGDEGILLRCFLC